MSQAQATAANAAAVPAAPAAKGGGTSKLVLVLVTLNLVAVAGVGGYVAVQLRHRPAPAAPHDAAATHRAAAAAAAHTPPTRGPIIPLEAIITNIIDAEETHFLKVTVQLEAKDEPAKLVVEAALVPIRDLVLLRLSSLTLADTQGAGKKRALQDEILRMINAELRTRQVSHVYFTEFVVQ